MNIEEIKDAIKNLSFENFCEKQKEAALLKIEEKRNEAILNISNTPLPVLGNAKEKEKLIILIDIVGFSKSTTREQLYKIYIFQRYILSQVLSNKFMFSEKINIDLFIPTGDGCYIIAEKYDANSAISFLVNLTGGTKYLKDEDGSAISIRASALIGNCIPFLDLAHHRNYVGEGMNEASRILSGGQAILEENFLKENPTSSVMDAKQFSRNSLCLGSGLMEYADSFSEDCTKIYRFNDVSDKHGKKRNLAVLQGI